MQDRTSFSINRSDTSVSRSKQLNSAIPASKIAALNSGKFVGMVAGNTNCKIELKANQASIQNDHDAIKKEQVGYNPLPVIRAVNNSKIQRNYLQIKQNVEDLVSAEIDRMLGDPGLVGLVVGK
jgi:hypothetical protein